MSNGDGLCVLYAARLSRPTVSWGFISPIPSWPWEKHNHRFRRTIALSLKFKGNHYVFVVVDLSDSVRWPFCTRSTRWPNSASKMYRSNAVFIKNMLQPSIIVHRALSLICLLCMPLWSLTRAIGRPSLSWNPEYANNCTNPHMSLSRY